MIKRVPAWLVWLIVGLQVVLVALRVLLDALTAAASSPLDFAFAGNELISVITILAFPVVGAIIYAHRPEHPIGWIFCAVNLGWAINNIATAYATYAVVVRSGGLPGVEFALWISTWPGMASMGLLVALVLLFPTGTLPSPRWRPFAWLVLLFVVLVTITLAFAPGPINGSIGFAADNPLGIPGIVGRVFALVAGLSLVAIIPILAAAAVSMILRYRRSSGLERQQLKWFLAALVFVTVAVALNVFLNFLYPVQAEMPAWAMLLNNLGTASTALIPIAAGVAVLRYRLYDIDLIIRRTLVYGALTATLALVYWGGVALLEALLRPVEGTGNDLAVVAVTLLIAAIFFPLRARIQGFIDRRFYRRKYDAARTLAAFAQVARDEVNLDALTWSLVGVVQETMQPEHVSLWVRPK